MLPRQSINHYHNASCRTPNVAEQKNPLKAMTSALDCGQRILATPTDYNLLVFST